MFLADAASSFEELVTACRLAVLLFPVRDTSQLSSLVWLREDNLRLICHAVAL